jgi:hypothetical protein
MGHDSVSLRTWDMTDRETEDLGDDGCLEVGEWLVHTPSLQELGHPV